METKKEWFVVYDKKEVIEKFYRVYAAKRFAKINNKHYFHLLDVMSEDVWNYEKEKNE